MLNRYRLEECILIETAFRQRFFTLTLKRCRCKRIEGARSEKDITRVSGTLSTGSIPVGRTSTVC
jgi:hypothetical protein